jgi:hypothetical protein
MRFEEVKSCGKKGCRTREETVLPCEAEVVYRNVFWVWRDKRRKRRTARLAVEKQRADRASPSRAFQEWTATRQMNWVFQGGKAVGEGCWRQRRCAQVDL